MGVGAPTCPHGHYCIHNYDDTTETESGQKCSKIHRFQRKIQKKIPRATS